MSERDGQLSGVNHSFFEDFMEVCYSDDLGASITASEQVLDDTTK